MEVKSYFCSRYFSEEGYAAILVIRFILVYPLFIVPD